MVDLLLDGDGASTYRAWTTRGRGEVTEEKDGNEETAAVAVVSVNSPLHWAAFKVRVAAMGRRQ